jgi:hypothetical protein
MNYQYTLSNLSNILKNKSFIQEEKGYYFTYIII